MCCAERSPNTFSGRDTREFQNSVAAEIGWVVNKASNNRYHQKDKVQEHHANNPNRLLTQWHVVKHDCASLPVCVKCLTDKRRTGLPAATLAGRLFLLLPQLPLSLLGINSKYLEHDV